MNKLYLFSFISIISCFCIGCSKNNSQNKSLDLMQNKNQFPQSIVALSPVSTEILFSIGAEEQISAVSNLADFPEEAKQKPFIGGFDGKTISMESIFRHKPDLVYLTNVMHNFMIPSLENYGINYYISKAESINDVEQEILDIGKITGHFQKAEKIVEEMKNQIEYYKTLSKTKQTSKIYYEVQASPYFTIGSLSFLNEIISTLNAKNIFDDLNENYPMISEESIILRNPEIILIPESSGLTKENIKMRKGWDSISAVQNDKIFIVDDNLYNRAGPRIPKIMENLYNLIY